MKKSLIVILLGLTGMMAGCGSHEKPSNGTAIKVLASAPVERDFRDLVRVQGMIEARQKASAAALTPGTLDAVFVDKGAAVTNGQALFQTDKVNLESRCEIERQNLKVAEASVEEARAGLRQVEAVHDKAALDQERFKQLYEKDKVVSQDAYERVTTAYKQAAAGRDHGRAMLDLALARKDQAAAGLRIAEKQLTDSLVRAPFDAVVSERFLEPGEFAGNGAKVLALKGASGYEARGHLAAAYLPRVAAHSTRAIISTTGHVLGEFPVTLSSPTIDFGTRTFEIRVTLTNASDIADGMACEMAIVLAQRKGLGIPSRAIGLRAGKPVVFVIDNGTARQVPVTPGIVDNGDTELLDAAALNGRPVVVDGQSFLNDNTPVRTE